MKAEGKKTEKLSKKEQQRKDVLDNWQSNHDMGKRKYILRFGALSWGIGTFTIYWILIFILGKINPSMMAYGSVEIIGSLVFFIIFGFIYGNILWNRNEKIFLEKYPYGKKKSH